MYNIDRRKKQNNYLKAAGIKVICIFQSPPESLRLSLLKEKTTPFIMLADPKRTVYKKYQVRRSKVGILLGAVNAVSSGKTMQIAKFITKKSMKSEGKVDSLPADFLIDETGVIVDMIQARHVNDFMPWERIEAFIPEGCRCNCEHPECLSPTCRAYNEERIRQSKNDGIFCG
uniref:Uncharacterized protein n=1 Tax=Odontella aurita TaxID=265563 RepID=A0A6U6KRI9_9STRA|mmetsp:Transcript_62228/g.184054  ORF Transcript_62228/g.184054 Transcript_62228/m.184054 type:complete len:173 (+) Transcript_62228:258-776(+)|eukprot:CAMPEP_0113570286 /NCGR_PEP_ID=MMETSP0015_2-20120614/24883_1 /TAXON_ID=2838 /ORGANISM="Odontella" /LENGTH=172 /DNA_ID=CAMNT_0000473047 /DNA_START=260 /DNA_END=778 /DNA_ORIENTATION=- /assembly_acc=CAM_ASM_000160